MVDQISQQYKHENRDRLCYYTNELCNKDELVKYRLHNRGYGSIFDMSDFTIQIHKDIAKELENDGILCEAWFDNALMVDKEESNSFCATYLCEEFIEKFIDNLIVENREYIQNSDHPFFPSIDRDDWIRENRPC